MKHLKKIIISIACLVLILLISNTLTHKPVDLSIYSGNNVKVAIIDTKVNFTKINYTKEKTEINFISEAEATSDHGTNIAKIILDTAPNVSLISLAAFDEEGNGQVDDVINALEWCYNNNVDIVNMSFSFTIPNDELEAEIKKLNDKDILLVASYNNLKNTYDYPAMYENVFGAKSSDNNDIKVSNNIIYVPSTELDGNSYAAAKLSGIISLIVEKNRTNNKAVNYDTIINDIKKG